MRKIGFVLLIAVIFTLLPFSNGHAFTDDKRKPTEVVEDFITAMSRGYLKYMDYCLSPDTHRGKDEDNGADRYKNIKMFYDRAHQVKIGKLKIFVDRLLMNGNSINGSTIGVRVRAKLKLTDKKTKKETIEEKTYRFILVRYFDTWRIVKIEDVEK